MATIYIPDVSTWYIYYWHFLPEINTNVTIIWVYFSFFWVTGLPAETNPSIQKKISTLIPLVPHPLFILVSPFSPQSAPMCRIKVCSALKIRYSVQQYVHLLTLASFLNVFIARSFCSPIFLLYFFSTTQSHFVDSSNCFLWLHYL